MKRYILPAMFCMVSLSASAQWNDVKIQQQGREKTRTQFISYDRRDDAETYDYTKAQFLIPMNGKWSFNQAASPSQTDVSFYSSTTGRDSVSVPSYWAKATAEELTAVRPPALPQDNPAGQYRKEVNIPEIWLDREIYLHVGGAKSAVSVYVNGTKAGYSEDSAAPTEFNITRHLAIGRNVIGLEVYKWSEGSWIEGNSIAGAGIAGDVYVYSQPKIRIDDLIIDASLDSLNKTGKFTLDIIVANSYNTDEQVGVHFDLEDAKGNIVKYNDRQTVIPGNGRDTVRFTANIANVAKWSAETPNTYQVIMRVRQNGRFLEYIPYKFGFRKLETVDGEMRINGRPVVLKDTVVLHTGIAPDNKTIRAELAAIKKAGYNAIECVYHPAKSRLYSLCLEQGLYVIDHINIDPSLTGRGIQMGGSVSNNPDWMNAYIFRGENAYWAHRNQSALVKWSLGETASAAMYNIYRLNTRMRELDKSGRYPQGEY